MSPLRPCGIPACLTRLAFSLATGVRLTLAILCLGIAGGTRPAAAQWTDVTTEALADSVFQRDKKGVAFVDYDGDGDLDVSVAGEGEHGLTLLRNDGGVFSDVTAGALLFPASGSSQTWGDYDNDGDPDLFFVTEETHAHLLRNDGGGAFTDVTAGPLLTPAHGHSSAWVDYDRDSDLDLYVANLGIAAPTPSRLYRNTVGGTMVDATTDSLGVLFGDGVAWGDYDNDGDQDVYLARFSSRPNLLLRNDHGVFTDVTQGLLGDAGNTHSCAWADVDNDGDLDLFFANANGPNRLLRNESGGVFVDATPPAMIQGAHSAGMSFGDYDNDGWIDLYLTMSEGATCHLFHNDGGTGFTDITVPAIAGTGAVGGSAAGDYDGDGDLDLYTASYFRRPNQLLRNDLANGNHWLEIDLEGTLSNRSAVGVRVSVMAGGITQIREITTCTGYRSQSAFTVHFGLGGATVVDRLLVFWPSGIVQKLELVPANQRFTIVEEGQVGVPAPPDSHFDVTVTPNPFAGGTRIEYSLPGSMPVRLDVIDLAGRRVRALEGGGTRGPGLHSVHWDGTDEEGRVARGGVYFVRLATRSETVVRRIVALGR